MVANKLERERTTKQKSPFEELYSIIPWPYSLGGRDKLAVDLFFKIAQTSLREAGVAVIKKDLARVLLEAGFLPSRTRFFSDYDYHRRPSEICVDDTLEILQRLKVIPEGNYAGEGDQLPEGRENAVLVELLKADDQETGENELPFWAGKTPVIEYTKTTCLPGIKVHLGIFKKESGWIGKPGYLELAFLDFSFTPQAFVSNSSSQ